MKGPALHLANGRYAGLEPGVTSVGRSPSMGIRLDNTTVSALHAELVRRGPYVYVVDLGLSRNGTFVNGRPIARRLLRGGDRICFGAESCQIILPDVPVTNPQCDTVTVTPRQRAVLKALCPINDDSAFVEPVSVAEIARQLGVSEWAVRCHLKRLAGEFSIPGGQGGQLARIANEAVRRGLVDCGPPGADDRGKPHHCRPRTAATPGGWGAGDDQP